MRIVKFLIDAVGKCVLSVILALVTGLAFVLMPVVLFFLGFVMAAVMARELWVMGFVKYREAFSKGKESS